MEEPDIVEPHIVEPDIERYRELLFNIVDQNMPADLLRLIRRRQDANDIINNAIAQIVQANPDDVDDGNPHPLMRNRPHVTELERIYNNIRTLLEQPQEPQGPQGPPQQLEVQGESIEPNVVSQYESSSFGGKLRNTSNKKRPTARRGRSSKARKSRKSRTTRRR